MNGRIHAVIKQVFLVDLRSFALINRSMLGLTGWEGGDKPWKIGRWPLSVRCLIYRKRNRLRLVAEVFYGGSNTGYDGFRIGRFTLSLATNYKRRLTAFAN
ncbi:hypothetical protein AU490_00190 [Lonsdalea populi]|uniref:Uncharacterized protein n=2 Tax=Lonsdalea TaxID=1082702 RepID=A0ACD1JFC6_9GAMM|nr:hypothetical protein AU508_00365 [Lonsdalea populi]RAT13985.1 hypothetical protein AU486_13725 [Lonsdalea quercina]OSN02752.1 hypothetical protein AU499_01245 [Lonsdalea populi]RAT15580.1 hypothetical protein AU485_03085 [Lonsdalea quercina]RAT23807.1 hypothetical protein AU487_00160 [Lonsdalea populi]